MYPGSHQKHCNGVWRHAHKGIARNLPRNSCDTKAGNLLAIRCSGVFGPERRFKIETRKRLSGRR
jgi:hypothetical protein